MDIPLLGREKELKIIKTGLEDAKSGRGRIYFITGASGIGKTRLIHEVCRIAQNLGYAVLSGNCIDEKGSPFLPINDALAKITREIEPFYTPIGLSGIEQSPLYSTNPLREQTRIFENYLRTFERLMATKPVLLTIDDFQWADSSTLGFIHYLARNVRKMSLVAVIAYQIESMRTGHVHQFTTTVRNINIERVAETIELKPLTEDCVAEVLNAITGVRKLPDKIVKEIHRRTEGNPFFVQEMGRALVEQGVFSSLESLQMLDMEKIELPETIRTMILYRFAKLDEDVKKVLKACAILGREFEYNVLKKLVDLDENKLLDILDMLIATDYLEESDKGEEVYRFVHNPVYEVVYSEIIGTRKRIMHGKAAAELEKYYGEKPKYAGEIGRHYILGGVPVKGIKFKIVSAAFALRNFAIEDCLKESLEAMKALESLEQKEEMKEEVLKVYEMLADCYYIMAEYEKEIQILEELLRHILSRNERARILMKLSLPYLKKGDFAASMQLLEKAELEAEPDAWGLKGEILKNRGWVFETKGEFVKAVENYRKSIELCKKAGDEIALGEVYNRMGVGLWYIGKVKEAIVYLERSLEIRKKYNLKKGIAGSYHNLGGVYDDIGDYQKAMEFFEISKKLYEEMGDLDGVASVYNNIGVIYYRTSEEPAKIIEFFKKYLEIAERTGERGSIALALFNIGSTYDKFEDSQSALEYYQKAYEIAVEIDDKKMVSALLNSISTCLASQGKIDRAMEFAQRAVDVAMETGSQDFIADAIAGMAEVLRYAGNYADAEKRYLESLKMYSEMGIPESINSVKFEMTELYIELGKKEIAAKLLEELKSYYLQSGNKVMRKKVERAINRLASLDNT
ncbi:MAG: tetratricopeptide repeat protein [Thermoplasmata archaeon]